MYDDAIKTQNVQRKVYKYCEDYSESPTVAVSGPVETLANTEHAVLDVDDRIMDMIGLTMTTTPVLRGNARDE